MLGFFELFSQLYARMCEYNSFKVDELAFPEFDIDDTSGISNDDDLAFFIPLFYGYSWFGDAFLTSVDPRNESDYTVLFCKVNGHFQGSNRTPIRINLYNTRIFKLTNHFIVNVYCRTVKILKLSLLQQLVYIIFYTFIINLCGASLL